MLFIKILEKIIKRMLILGQVRFSKVKLSPSVRKGTSIGSRRVIYS